MNRTPEFYYTSRVRDLDPTMTCTHLLFSAASNLRDPTSKDTRRILVPQLPASVKQVGTDPGGYIVTQKYGEQYPFTPEQYLDWLTELQPAWAATFDLTCTQGIEQTYYSKAGKPFTCQRLVSPGESIVRRRQEQTTSWAHTFFARWPDTPWAWMPTIQGFEPAEYECHARDLAPLIHRMYSYYLLTASYHHLFSSVRNEVHPLVKRFLAFRVGIGSLVGRDRPGLIREIVLRVRAVLGEQIPLHLWGVKRSYLKAGQQLEGVLSYDTSAFDDRFDQEGRERQKASGLTQRTYRWKVAQPAYADAIQQGLHTPPPLLLFPPEQTEPYHFAHSLQEILPIVHFA